MEKKDFSSFMTVLEAQNNVKCKSELRCVETIIMITAKTGPTPYDVKC